jgi:hypothetical protein
VSEKKFAAESDFAEERIRNWNSTCSHG